MAWHKFATIKTNVDGNAGMFCLFGCASEQGVNYEVHEVAETKPDTISAIITGSSSFDYGYENIMPSITAEEADTEYDFWFDLDAQVYTSVSLSAVLGTVPSVNLSNSVLDVATYSLDNIGLETLTGIDGLTNLNSLTITGNALTAAAQDAIILKVWDNAISKASTGKTFNILNNDGTYSAQSAAYLTALSTYRDWNINTGNGALLGVTNVSNVADLQLVAFNLAGTIVLTKDIDASATATWSGGAGFVPIGNQTTPFSGSINGNGYKITNLYIDRVMTYLGLIGVFKTTAGIIQELALINPYIRNTMDTTANWTGALIGWVDGAAFNASNTIRRCYVQGGEVIGTLNSSSCRVGGLFGSVGQQANISNCYVVSPTITGGGGLAIVGGMAGRLVANGSDEARRQVVTNCHSYGTQRDIYGSLSAGDYQTLTGLYQLKTNPPENVTALSADDFKPVSSFTGWDFNTIWMMVASYPELIIFNGWLFASQDGDDDMITITNAGGTVNLGLVGTYANPRVPVAVATSILAKMYTNAGVEVADVTLEITAIGVAGAILTVTPATTITSGAYIIALTNDGAATVISQKSVIVEVITAAALAQRQSATDTQAIITAVGNISTGGTVLNDLYGSANALIG